MVWVQKETLLVLFVYLTKLLLRMIVWKEQEPEAELGFSIFLSVRGDGRKKFKSIFALDFFDMNILPPGKQLGEFSVSLEFHSELASIFASFVLSKCQWM